MSSLGGFLGNTRYGREYFQTFVRFPWIGGFLGPNPLIEPLLITWCILLKSRPSNIKEKVQKIILKISESSPKFTLILSIDRDIALCKKNSILNILDYLHKLICSIFCQFFFLGK